MQLDFQNEEYDFDDAEEEKGWIGVLAKRKGIVKLLDEIFF